jgi:hypothetical protein
MSKTRFLTLNNMVPDHRDSRIICWALEHLAYVLVHAEWSKMISLPLLPGDRHR